MNEKQQTIRATYMRGGTSKGVFFVKDDIPAPILDSQEKLDAMLLRVIGSPDPYGQQMDGMGAATSSTSKVVLISKSKRTDCDIDYWFGAIAIDKPVVDWSGNCGNLSSAVGPFAINRGLVHAPDDGMAIVRIWQANIQKIIIAHVPMQDGDVQELGDFELDGVAFPAAEIQLEFLDPGAEDDDGGGAMFPTGNLVDTFEVPGVGTIEATLINAGNPTIFVEAGSIGLIGTEMQREVNADAAFLQKMESIRAYATVVMGLAKTAKEATETRPHTPKLAFVTTPKDYIASSGKSIAAVDLDITARIMSMGKLHHAMTGTGAVAIAVAAVIPGTMVHQQLVKAGRAGGDTVRFGHPSGSLKVGAEAKQTEETWLVTKAMMSRNARRLMDGVVFV